MHRAPCAAPAPCALPSRAPPSVATRRATRTPPPLPPRRARTALRAAPEVFEAQGDPAQLVVLGATAALGAFWWCGAAARALALGAARALISPTSPTRLVVVPSERQALAKAKRKGDVREYMEQIQSARCALRVARFALRLHAC
jgi:hypothetical protein